MSDELADWSQEWRKTGSVPPDLLTRVRRDRRQALLGLVGGWVAALALATWCGLLFVAEDRPANRTALAFATLISPLMMLAYTRREAALRRAEGAAAAGCLAEWQRRLRDEIALGRTWWPFALVAGFVLAWTPWKLMESRELYAGRPMLAVAGVLGLVLLLVGTALAQVLLRRRNELKAAALEQLAHEVESE